MSDVMRLVDQTVSRFVRSAMGTSSLGASIDRLRLVRAETQRLTASLSDAQATFSQGAGKWSVAEIVDHLILTDGLYQEAFLQMIARGRSGDESTLRIGYSEMNPTVGPLPRAIMPYVAPVFSLFSTLMPHAVRETMLRLPFLPSGNPTATTPRPGRNAETMRTDLAATVARTQQILSSDLPPSFPRLQAEHPILGTNTAAQLLDLMSAHEERHHLQIRAVLNDPRCPRN